MIVNLPAESEAKESENHVDDFKGLSYSPFGVTLQNLSSKAELGIQKFSKTKNPLSIPCTPCLSPQSPIITPGRSSQSFLSRIHATKACTPNHLSSISN